MASLRDKMSNAAERELGDQFKRSAPVLTEKTVAETTSKRERDNLLYGIPTSFRFQQSTRDVLEAAASKHNVKKSDLAEFLILAGVRLLEIGTIGLPLSDEQERRIDLTKT